MKKPCFNVAEHPVIFQLRNALGSPSPAYEVLPKDFITPAICWGKAAVTAKLYLEQPEGASCCQRFVLTSPIPGSAFGGLGAEDWVLTAKLLRLFSPSPSSQQLSSFYARPYLCLPPLSVLPDMGGKRRPRNRRVRADPLLSLVTCLDLISHSVFCRAPGLP